ncbi:MAG: hypothetical protein WD066_03530 [Planctomycetaceae bacterium]
MRSAKKLLLSLLIVGIASVHPAGAGFIPEAAGAGAGAEAASARSPQPCCCGTSDGRCCGLACCETPSRSPGQDSPTPQPEVVRNLLLGQAFHRGDVPRFADGSWRSGPRAAADPIPAEVASLQAQQVRLDV